MGDLSTESSSKGPRKVSATAIQQNALTVVIAIFGCAASRFLNIDLGLGNSVIAAAIVGLVGGLFFGKYAGVNNAGAFAGMSSTAFIPSIEYTVPVGFMVGLVWIALTSRLGFGGKQGTAGLISVVVFSLILSFFGSTVAYSAPRTRVDAFFAVSIVMTCAVTTLLMAIFRDLVIIKVFKRDDSVLAESIMSLVGGLILPHVPVGFSKHLNVVMAEGTYAGMTPRKALPTYTGFLIVGVIGGLVYILMMPLFPGVGGKLGTMGCVSNLIFQAIRPTRSIEKNTKSVSL